MIRQIIDLVLADLRVIDLSGVKPNYAAIGRKYNMDPRTVKKYHEGYQGKAKNRNKPSKLDSYREEIANKLSIRRTSIRSVYEFMRNKYSDEAIGSYSNFKTYVKKHSLNKRDKSQGHPRYECEPGDMIQADWKEDITLVSRKGEIFVINVLHLLLKFSRYSYLEVTKSKDQSTLFRALINGFRFFGGISKRVLFDNMSTAANVSVRPKMVNEKMKQFARDIGFSIQLCKARSPETKGSNEARNKILDWFRPYNNDFDDFCDLQKICEQINARMNMDVCQGTGVPPSLLYTKEKEYLLPLPFGSVYLPYLSLFKAKVGSDSMISYRGSRYSTEPKLIGEYVEYEADSDKLYIYYKGILQTVHDIGDSPFNYKQEHYKALMKGKADALDIDEIARNNLSMMDRILEEREVYIDRSSATESMKFMEAYLASGSDHWIVVYYARLQREDRKLFFETMKKLLPLIDREEDLFRAFKDCLKDKRIDDLAVNMWLYEFENHSSIFTQQGFFQIERDFHEQIGKALRKDAQKK
ncbi:MAG: IS21 family transposase [Oscillospiraceae bacterium]|nr:IS21 family transposase [Oscillospiraceae bacterium]